MSQTQTQSGGAKNLIRTELRDVLTDATACTVRGENMCYLFRVPTQMSFSNYLCFPCPTANFPCAVLSDL